MPRSALVIIDFINEFAFEGGERLARRALPAARATVALRDRLPRGTPVIYANDNFGKWRSDFRQAIARCGADESRGREIVRLLNPRPEDHFVLKPRHSAFFDTPLDSLLKYLKVKRLILAGVAIDACVQFTANDAYLREFDLWIPADCVAGESRQIETETLRYFSRVLSAVTARSTRRGR